MILTVAVITASWPATSFLIMYYDDPQNTGALVVGGFFACSCYVGFSVLGLVKDALV